MDSQHALVIDDNAQNLEVLKRLLNANGISSTCLEDSRHLQTALEQMERLDVVFLDIEMPNIDGYQILESLRASFGSSFPIIACTVYSNEIANARALGFDGFLAKPLNPQNFSTQLTRIMSGQPVWDAS
jgi:two-component system, cell cycle response regulator DivK